MSQVSIRIRDEWLLIPCPDRSQCIRWLGVEALRRYTKAHPSHGVNGTESFILRRCLDEEQLDLDDSISSVIHDNIFIELSGSKDVGNVWLCYLVCILCEFIYYFKTPTGINEDTWEESKDLLQHNMYPLFVLTSLCWCVQIRAIFVTVYTYNIIYCSYNNI